jgi:tetratricopeptide (TPR) repeat protein
VRLRVPGALFAAAIFALHPVNVESVAWIAQLKGILSLALALASVLFYLDHERRGGRWRYVLAIAAFALSALAKGTALTLPIVLLALAWWQRGRITRRDLLRVAPYALVGAVMAGVEVWGQHLVAHGEVVRSDGLLSRAALAGRAVWFYLGKLACPLQLCFFYPRWTLCEPGVLPYLPGAVLAVLAALAWFWRATWGRSALMLLVCYVGLLLPVLGFVDIFYMRYSLVADHWQYAAMLVPCAVFAGVSASLARRIGLRLPVNLLLSLALLAALAGLSWRQSRMYDGPEILYRTTIESDPACWRAHENLGIALVRGGQTDAAVDSFRRVLQIAPDCAEAHEMLGLILARRGRVDEAIAHLRRALKLKPHLSTAHYNLGNILLGRGQAVEAIAQLEDAVAGNPEFAEAHNNLALALADRGDFGRAIEHYRKAIAIEPGYAEAYSNLGIALCGAGCAEDALAQYRKALQIDPDCPAAHYNVANVLARRGQFPEAVAHYQNALRSKPDYADAHNNLASVLAGRGRLDEAIEHFRKALEIKPDVVGARQNLAVAVSERERITSAIAERRAALQRRPGDAALLNDIAWMLATNPNASIRNGAEAVRMAERALHLSGGRNPAVLDTLAAAYAEAGRFPEAVRTAREAMRLATAVGDRALAEKVSARVELYRSGTPHRQQPRQ